MSFIDISNTKDELFSIVLGFYMDNYRELSSIERTSF
jgi:hypothetical protein